MSLSLAAFAARPRIIGGDAHADVLLNIENGTGSTFGDFLIGSEVANVLAGSNGNDTLERLGGGDTLSGGIGQDTATYAASDFRVTVDLAVGTGTGGDAAGDTLISIENLIVDFTVADDTIQLDDGIFSGLAAGTLAANQFVVGAAAQDADDRIVYDDTNCALLFDSDGVGGAAAVQFASVGVGLAVTNLDFLVV
jgi:serralysin